MTTIEWTERTWNPTTGCDKVSPGCDNCYALTMAARLKAMGNPKYQRDGDPTTSGPGFAATVHPTVVNAPLRWRKPARIFVNSMADLLHDRVPDEWVAEVFAVMAASPQHTYQLLTKRHARLRSLLNRSAFMWDVMTRAAGKVPPGRTGIDWPLRNLWVGVSVEDQKWADIRIPALLETPAVVRWISAEPLLGPVDLSRWLTTTPALGWVVAGGESGAGARPMRPGWARQLRDQCTAAAVPFLFKQWGSHRWVSGHRYDEATQCWEDYGIQPERVSKKLAGRVLDGRTWDEYPAEVA